MGMRHIAWGRLWAGLAVAACFAFGTLACGDDRDGGGNETPTAGSTARATITSTASVTAASARSATPIQPTPELTPRPSGNELIDAVIEAVETADAAKLEGLLHLFSIECTGGAGAVPCADGKPVGTTVPVVGSGGCEGGFLREGDEALRSALSRFVGTPPDRRLYAVVVTPPFPGDERVPGDFMVIFRQAGEGPDGSPASAVSVDQEGITYLHSGCGPTTTVESFTHGSTQYLIPPDGQ